VAAVTFEGEGRKGEKRGSSFRFLSLSLSRPAEPANPPFIHMCK